MLNSLYQFLKKDSLKLLRHDLTLFLSPSLKFSEMSTKGSIAESKLHHHEPHSNLVWVDCEMSGLDIDKDVLLEVAVIITDSNLNEIETCGPLVIKSDLEVLDSMNDWCRKTHKKSGLYDACLQSQLTIKDVDNKLYDLLTSNSIKVAALAGNSVSYDRQFLKKYCPRFGSLLHYRLMDVSSIKEIVRRWYPTEANFKKKSLHRALDDIRDSINELKYYKKKFFRDPQEVLHSNP